MMIKKNFLLRKRFTRFKEKVVILKFKVFQHFWKEHQQFSVRKLLPKSHKKLNPSRTVKTGYLKHRSCSRSRPYFPVGDPSLVSTGKAMNFLSGLLSDSQFNFYRSTLKMPALILDDKEKTMSKFISSNGLVEDPFAAEMERSTLNPWTSEEKDIFVDKLAAIGKDFQKIASFLDQRTTADCIEFYYKNHKSECFVKARSKLDFPKQGKSKSSATYLVSTGIRWNPDANAASLDVLTAASAVAANNNECLLQQSNSLSTDNSERETVAADVLAAIGGSLSSEGMSSSITTSIGTGTDHWGWMGPRKGLSTKRLSNPIFLHYGNEFSDEICVEMEPADWTDEEKSIFIQAVSSHGKDFEMISQCVGTRSRDQCKIFFCKSRKVLGLDLIQPEVCNAVCDDDNGGGADLEDACVVETDSVICSERSGSKVGDEIPINEKKLSHDIDMAGTLNLKPDHDGREEEKMGFDDSTDAEPVLKRSMPDDCREGRKMDLEFDVDCSERNRAINGSSSAEDHVTAVVVLDVESAPVEDGDDQALHNTLINVQNIAPLNIERHHMANNTGQRLQESEDSVDDKKVAVGDVSSSKVSGVSCSTLFIKPVPELSCNISQPPSDAHSSKQFGIVPGCQKRPDDFKLSSAEKLYVMPSQQSDHLASFKPSPQFSAKIKDHKGSVFVNSLAGGTDGESNVQIQKDSVASDFLQDISGHSPHGKIDTSPILMVYPVSVSSMEEVNVDVNCRRPISLQSSTGSANSHSEQHSNFSLTKCNISRHQASVAEASSSFQDVTSGHSTGGISSSSVENSCRNGNFKLFGKVLNSSEETPYSGSPKSDGKNIEHKTDGDQLLNTKLSADQTKSLAILKFGPSECLSCGDSPRVSFGDGNRALGGVPPLPDSASLLVKYSATFSSFPMPSAKLEHSALQGVVKSNQGTLKGALFFQPED